jgi:hypothetical protein
MGVSDHHLTQASRLVMFSYSSVFDSSDMAKAGLEEKAIVINAYLDTNLQDWQVKVKRCFSNSVLRIVKMIYGTHDLDCSVFYLCDQILVEITIDAYHAHICNVLHISTVGICRFYNHFYSIKFIK